MQHSVELAPHPTVEFTPHFCLCQHARIGILGSGNMGGALGRLFSAAGHGVTYSYSRKPAKLEALARYLEPMALLVAELAYEQDLGPELGITFLRYTDAK